MYLVNAKYNMEEILTELTFGIPSTTAVRYIESARKALLEWAQDLMAWPSETERRENGLQLRDGRLIMMVVD